MARPESHEVVVGGVCTLRGVVWQVVILVDLLLVCCGHQQVVLFRQAAVLHRQIATLRGQGRLADLVAELFGVALSELLPPLLAF